jgi:hypothetical protein
MSTGELSCIVLKPDLPEPFLFSTLVKWHLLEPFIAQGRAVTMSPEVRQVTSGQVKPYDVGHNG